MATYQKLVYNDGTTDGVKVQVQSAIEDSYGNNIYDVYLKKADRSVKWSTELTINNSESGTLTKPLNSVPTGIMPRIIQVFTKSTVSSTDSYILVQTDATLQVSSNAWSAIFKKPIESGEWYVRIIGW